MMLVALTLRASALLLAALVLVRWMPRRSAADRHWLLAATVFGVLALPTLTPLAPSWSSPLSLQSPLAWSPAAAHVVVEPSTRPAVATAVTAVAQTPRRARLTPFSLQGALVIAWACGVGITLCVLATRILRLYAIVRRSRHVVDANWTGPLEQIITRYRWTRPVALRESPQASLLVAFGWRCPMILLPPAARQWSGDRVEIVLAHELAHIVRGDWGVQLAGELLRALLWFNPLAWLVLRRLRDESERACDDLVLGAGHDPAAYASELLTLARALQTDPAWHPAPAMARSSSLERRVTAMFDLRLARTQVSRSRRVITVCGMVATAALLAGFTASAQSFSSVSGQTRDAFGGHIGGATITLSNTVSGQKYLVSSTAGGQFEIVGVAPGAYVLEVRRAGFANVQQPLTVTARSVHHDVLLTVGSLEEHIYVGAPPAPPPPPAPGAGRAVRSSVTPATKAEACVPTANGGLLTAPTKTVDKRPTLPPGYEQMDLATNLQFDATIGVDGTVTDVSAPKPGDDVALAMAATEAIRQWQYTPTLLNCTPIPVSMRVTVNFRN